MKGTKMFLALIATTVTSMAAPPVLLAAEGGFIEEIVVTARQRDETLQETPVTITALSGDTIERLALNNLDQLSDMVPNLLVSYGSSGGSATVTLRGIGTGSGSAGFSSAVGLLIDDVHSDRGRWIQGGIFDLEQVEVLKGPQSLYFGKNNTSGLIILRSRDPIPGEDSEANFKLGYEFDAGEYLAEGGLSFSVSDTLAMRLAVRRTEQTKGWITNNAQPQTGVDPFGYFIPGAEGHRDLPGLEETMGRFTTVWTPTDRFTAKFKAAVSNTDDEGPLFHDQLDGCFGPGGQPQRVFGVPSPDDDCKANFKRSKTSIPAGMMVGEPAEFGDGASFTEYDAERVSLLLEYDLDAVKLTSVTGYTHYDSDLLDNATFAGDGQVPFFERTDHKSFSQELRVQTQFESPLNFMGGLLYTDNDLYFRNSARVAPFPRDSRNGRQWTWDKVANEDSKAFSAYGELVWDITETIELSGGARYTDEERDFVFTVPHLHEFFDVFIPGILSSKTLAGTFKDDNVSPQVTLSWSPTDQVTVFGAYREGFKSGGFDASHTLAASAVIDDIRFESEEADGFEIGIKSRWLDESIQLNATAYFFDYKNLQVTSLDTETTQFRIQNAAAASTEGVEVELTWAPREDLTVRGFVNYNLAEYDEFLTNCFAGQSVQDGCDKVRNPTNGRFISQDVGGTKVPISPEWSVTLGFTYDWVLGASGWTASLDLDSRYSGSYSRSLLRLPDSKADSYVIFDGSVRVYSPDERWQFTLIGRNLFDKLVVLGQFDRPLTGSGNGLPAGDPALQRADLISRVLRGRQIWLEVGLRI
jgi:outer membrane receptor protein involved in Fe transport